MSDTTSPLSVHYLHPLSSSSSMSSTDSAPQSEPTSDEQPDLGAFTTVLRAWTYLQPLPRIPVQIYSPTTSTTTTFQPDQSVVDSDFQNNSQALLQSSSSSTGPLNSSVLHDESAVDNHALPPSFTPPPSSSIIHEESTIDSRALPLSTSSFTRPPSSSVLQEESTVWNHAPIASYLYSATPSIDVEDEISLASTEGRTVEINSELSFDDRSSLVSSQTTYQDVAVPVLLEPPLLLPQSESSALTSRIRTNPLPSSDTISSSSNLSLLSYQIPESEDSGQDLLLVAQRTATSSLKSQRSSSVNSNSATTPTSGPPPIIPVLSVQQQQQEPRTVPIYPSTQSTSDDASVSHLSLPPADSPPSIRVNLHSNPHSHLPQQQPPKLDIGTSTLSTTRGISGGRQGMIVVDDSSTPDPTPDSVLVDWKSGKAGGFRPVNDDREEVGKKTRAYGYGFGFGRVQQQSWGQGQKRVSGYTSNYEGSQSSFRTRRSEMRGRLTRLEPQNEDLEDSNFNSDAAEHHPCDDIEEEAEERDGYPFPRYRRRSGEFHFQTHTPRYYGRTHAPPRGVLPTQPEPQLQSMGQSQSQSSMEVLCGDDDSQPYVQPQPQPARQQFYSHLDSYPDPYPRPHARPHIQDRDRDIYSSRSSHSSMSSLPSISSSPSRIEPSPIQRDYVLIQPQTQLPALMSLQSFSQQTQTQQTGSQPQPQIQPLSQAQARTSHTVPYLSTQNQSTAAAAAAALSSVPAPIPVPAASVSIPLSAVSVSVSVSVSIPPPTVTSLPVSSSRSNPYQGQGTVMSEDHDDALLLLSSNKHGPSPSPPLSSVSLSPLFLKTNEKVLDKPGTGNKPGGPDQLEKASWECVDLEEDELVSVSERSSSVGGGVGVTVVSSGSGLGTGSGLGLGQPSPKVQQPLSPSTKQQQPLTKHSSMNQQQRHQFELQFQQSDVQTRLHVESDSDGPADRGSTTTAGAGASVLVSELITATTTAPSTTMSTTTTTDAQPQNLNLIPNISKPKFDPRVNNHPKPSYSQPHSHSHPQSDSRYHSHYSYPASRSELHVVHMEDTTESEELDLDLDGLDHGASMQRVGDRGDALLPSLGYLDEALSFIAEERARWSAAKEGVGAGVSVGGSGGVDEGLAKGGGGKREGWKVLDHDMVIPKRKRRRKRRPQQPQSLSNFTLGAQPPTTQALDASHTADEDEGGPSTSTSSAKKKKKARSSSWSPVKKKNNRDKEKEKEFLIGPPSQSPSTSTFPPPAILVQPATARMVLPSRPVELLSTKGQSFSKQDEDGGRTPTNGSGAIDVFGPVDAVPTNSSGKRGTRMGKKERERERLRKDLLMGQDVVEKAASRERIVDAVAYEEDDDNEGDNDENDEDEEDEAVSHDELSVKDDSSLNNLSLLQPPKTRHGPGRRKKGKDIAHIHRKAGIAGAYKSTPGSPKRRREFDDIPVDQEGGGEHELLVDVGVEDNAGGGVPDMTPDGSIGKKHTLTKRHRGLGRVRSVPQLDAEEPTLYAVEETARVSPGKSKSKKGKSKVATTAPALTDNGVGDVDLLDKRQPQTKRGRLIALAKKLRQFFPEQRQELRRVSARFEKQSMEAREKDRRIFLTGDSVGMGISGSALTAKSAPIPVPGVRRSRRGIHYRSGSESAVVNINDDSIAGRDAAGRDDMPEVEEEDEEELDPRGRPPKKSDVLIHVFIDHSNILIGLLSYLRRFPLSNVGSKGTKRGHPLATISAKATPTVSMSHVTTSALAFAAVKPTSTRPLPSPNSTTSGNGKASANTSIPIAVPGDYRPRIPLPSFATVSRSLPSRSVLNGYLVENDNGSQIEEKDVHSDRYEYHQGEDEDVDDLGQITSLAKAWKYKEKEKKPLKHLWHAALVLLLERGRSITRRVVVTSSPLYQPMDGIERLGYELRVYLRVPDLGDGMDRGRKDSSSLSGGSKSVQSSPANPVSFSGLPLTAKNKRQMLGHVRRISGSTSAESGSGGGGSGNASGGANNANNHPYYGIANNTPPQGKIKYREQGVDELLQLKLHQALAATDDVPEGSTIVLATGDGNMGQFNEEGFLGPIRTALRRGWKVELYAWEDCLSRAWRREFGEDTEWGRKGMFRIIGMEQFADSLVEIVDP